MTFRTADHPIAHDKAAVHFWMWQPVGQRDEVDSSIKRQRYLEGVRLHPKASAEAKAELEARKAEKKKIRARHYANDPSGLWTLPHAVSLQNPFTTACGVPYLGGMQVPSIWEGNRDNYVETHWFELLDIRAKCLGCAGAIGADPGA